MPLFRGAEPSPSKAEKQGVRKRKARTGRGRGGWEEDGRPPPLSQLCLWNLAENMKEVWVKDYHDNYMDQYCFRHIMGPFNQLPGELVEDLLAVLSSRRELSRAALHLLLVPQLRGLSLGGCYALVTPIICTLIGARCQALYSLDLSGAQQVSPQVQCDLLGCLPSLRSLSLAATLCDRRVLRVVAHHCRALRHLDVSRCHNLSPADLLALGGSTSTPPPPLGSLLALDVGFGEEEGDAAAAAAFLLLSLPRLERAALEGLGEGCRLIRRREFGGTEELTARAGVSSLKEVWRERVQQEGAAGVAGERERERGKAGAAVEGEEEEEDEEEERILWRRDESESEDEGTEEETRKGADGKTERGKKIEEDSVEKGEEGGRTGAGEECFTLCLREVQGLTCRSLEAVSQLCPDLRSITLDCEEEEVGVGGLGWGGGSRLAAGLGRWGSQLRSLSVRYPGPLDDLLPTLGVVGASLLSLTLEGVTTSPHTPMMELLNACPRLRSLLIQAEPPSTPQEEEEEEEEEEEQDNSKYRPCLPQLGSLSLSFSYNQQQKKPVMSWGSLKEALWCLLSGSPLLERVSLVAVPCPLDPVFWKVLKQPAPGDPDCSSPPLQRLRNISLARSDVSMVTAAGLVSASSRLSSLDLTGCWAVSLDNLGQLQKTATRRRHCLTITWT